jgi:hypothetical protein
VSDQRSLGRARSRSHGTGRSRVYSETESDGESTGWSSGESRSRGGGRSEAESQSRGENFSESYDVPVNPWRSGEGAFGQAAAFGVANARQVTSGYDRGESHSTGRSEDWSDAKSTSHSYARQQSRATSIADGTTESVSDTQGTTWGSTHGVAHTTGRHADRSRSRARSRQESTGETRGTSNALGSSWARGWSEALTPILRLKPTAVHSLQNVTHMAAETLCSLPTGVAVVRTVGTGGIEGAVVRVPERPCPSVSDQQYASDLDTIMTHSGSALPMREAQAQIEARERALIAAVVRSRPPAEPSSFRVSAPRQNRSRAEPGPRKSLPVKGGRRAAAASGRNP